eukprot:gene12965-14958_t
MGCGASTVPVSNVGLAPSSSKGPGAANPTSGSNKFESTFYVQTINYKSPMIRLDHIEEPKIIRVKGQTLAMDLKFVYVSQRGFYPSDPGKANQDSYVICESFLGDHNCNLFGIFDGHGTYGDLCAYHAADEVPKNLAKQINKNGGLACLDGPKTDSIYTKAFVDTDKALHSTPYIDDSLSGTTAVTVLQVGDRLLVANVGDSRAIIASNVNGKLVYSPLSNDQTPYRKDERERLKKLGARIMTIDQVEGNEPLHENFGTQLGNEIDEGGDPPRVWDQTLEKPGCAFSRSIGDNVAKKVGVCAEPEILHWDLTENDRFAIVASDGVFEFITSQNVVDMIAKFEDPIEGAKHVVAEAYRLWLTFDDRTDDITIIVIYFENIKSVGDASERGAAGVNSGNYSPRAGKVQRAASISRGMLGSDGVIVESRPVRKVMSKARREEITENFANTPADDLISARFDFNAVKDTKSDADIARISKMLASNFMFRNLTATQKEKVYRVMTLRHVVMDEVIIREGDKGDEMYIVESGEFMVRKKDDYGVEQVVFVYTVEGSAFGELSLMYGKPRAASVIAKTNGKLWSIGRAAFRAVIMLGKQEGDGLLEVYRSIPLFQALPLPTLQRLCTQSVEYAYEKGQTVVTEETMASVDWCFCIITLGVMRLLAKAALGTDGKKRQLRNEYNYFSIHELGSKFVEIKADSKMKISCIPNAVALQILGPEGLAGIKDTFERSKSKGKRLQTEKLCFENNENFALTKIPEIGRFALENVAVLLGTFGYIGVYKDSKTSKLCSIKVIAKANCAHVRMDARMLQERNFLASMHNAAPAELIVAQENWMPTPLGIMQDDKKVYMLYKDLYACDLSLALAGGAIETIDKPYCMACIYSALRTIHEFGLQHRYINANSIYVTTTGVPKICDFRFAKQMKGAHSFTICGDPLFFSPEIVNHQGYDYSADLWAFGVLCYEMCEESTPFGDSSTDETAIFKK